ncbi:protein tofu-2-like isoform X2 [Daphnia pulicaria]|uniref:protein tofu-2-like isoform X2 n=1 Tax=Daphnia pulicaria TaxID=35523 RepID=UPI001EEB5150|nr:protein tofu-2-like isoform X2 [Daphnia pulicaria]
MTSNGESGDSAVKVYVKEERLTVEEDMLHEFKGHRNFSKDDIPQAAIINKTQRPISRNLCGFLNTGAGGVVYCGVTDNGEVQGIHLTNYQKDHGMISQLYVIEIEVFPWNPKSPLSVTSVTPIHPLFCNEEGLHFVRRLGGLHRPTLAEVIQLAEVDTARYHTMNKK